MAVPAPYQMASVISWDIEEVVVKSSVSIVDDCSEPAEQNAMDRENYQFHMYQDCQTVVPDKEREM